MRCTYALALAALLALGSPASAADAATCESYANEAAAKAEAVRTFSCGYDLKDHRWGTDRGGHARWCRAASKDAVAAENAQRRGQLRLCQICRAYADLAIAAHADNLKLKCGQTGPRWTGAGASHFEWCMARREPQPALTSAAAYQSAATTLQKAIAGETASRIEAIQACKSPQPVKP